jgi:hypothetical protein
MTNREKVRAAIAELGDDALKEEIAERVAIWAEEPELHDDGETFDDIDAFDDLLDATTDKLAAARMNRILVRAGYYVAKTDVELARFVMSSGRPYDLKLDGIKYQIAGPWSTWIDR